MHQVLSIILSIVAMVWPGFDKHAMMQKIEQNFSEVHQFMDQTRSYIDTKRKENVKKVQSDEFIVSGFWESYRGPLNPGKGDATNTTYYENDVKNFNEIIYSFLTLDNKPNATHPRDRAWDGQCIYDATTQDCAANSIAWDDSSNP